MANAEESAKSIRYIIRVKDHLNSHWVQWFEGMSLEHTDEGETILSGDVADQSALHGLLEKIRNLNLTLLSVKRAGSDKGKRPA